MKQSCAQNVITHHPQNKQLAEFVRDQLKALILSSHYTCMGAKAAFNRNAYLFGLYETMGSESTTQLLYSDLRKFIDHYQLAIDVPSTFVVSFKTPNISSEIKFERLLWQQLQMLHDIDSQAGWDPAFSKDPEMPNFSFSVLQRSFFVVGLHPASSRWARRFAWPTLVFNSQAQFESMKTQGKYQMMERTNRSRDQKLQGGINPNLLDFADRSEARQYSGRHVEENWKCPFHSN